MRGPIVVGTDFRAQADRAIDRAVQLGRDWDVEVIAVHARDPAQENGASEDDLTRRLHAVLPYPAATVSTRFPIGEPAEALAAVARETGASLVVIGEARHNDLKDYVLGTATDRIIRAAPVPALVVKNRSRTPYRAIVTPAAFDPSSVSAIEWAADMFPDARLSVVYAFHVPFEGWQKADYVRDEMRGDEQRRLDAFVEELRPETQSRVSQHLSYGDMQAALSSVAQEVQADLVVIGTHGESGLRHAAFGGTAAESLQAVPLDALIVRLDGQV